MTRDPFPWFLRGLGALLVAGAVAAICDAAPPW